MCVVLCLIVFGCQYQCNWLPGKTRLRMTYYVSSGTLNPIHSLTHSPTHIAYPDILNRLTHFHKTQKNYKNTKTSKTVRIKTAVALDLSTTNIMRSTDMVHLGAYIQWKLADLIDIRSREGCLIKCVLVWSKYCEYYASPRSRINWKHLWAIADLCHNK